MYFFLKISIILIDIEIDFRDTHNKQILSFLLKIANYKTKRSHIIMLIQTIQFTL